jgi:hypothetical protein
MSGEQDGSERESEEEKARDSERWKGVVVERNE